MGCLLNSVEKLDLYLVLHDGKALIKIPSQQEEFLLGLLL